ncbi:hypothetical protein [Rhizobium sp. BK176]|uniref:hypothetical protein n=1 Tax=Rhizobium sp. BK176 TaxID=2587071 RepID=UPI002169AB43|nr:hypothetical protein [Rhizobium sp. BK176]MCS4088822.1 hypothetical protein [Rhizobium sp. BK176]
MVYGPTAQCLMFAGTLCALSLLNPDVRHGIDVVFNGEQAYSHTSQTAASADYSSIMKQIDDVDARIERLETRLRASKSIGQVVYQQALNETCTANGHSASASTPEAERRMCKTVAEGFRAVAGRDGAMIFYRIARDGRAIGLDPFVVEGDDHYFDIDAVKTAFKA